MAFLHYSLATCQSKFILGSHKIGICGFAGVEACGAAFCVCVDVLIGPASGESYWRGQGSSCGASWGEGRSWGVRGRGRSLPGLHAGKMRCAVLWAPDPKQSKCVWTGDCASSRSTCSPLRTRVVCVWILLRRKYLFKRDS